MAVQGFHPRRISGNCYCAPCRSFTTSEWTGGSGAGQWVCLTCSLAQTCDECGNVLAGPDSLAALMCDVHERVVPTVMREITRRTGHEFRAEGR